MSNTQKAKEEIRRLFKQALDDQASLWPSRRREVLQAATNAGNVAQQNIVYVGKHGADTNDGETINRAYLTLQAAISAASAGDVVVCLDAGEYSEDVTCAADVDVFAPNATLIVNGTDQLTLASCSVALRSIQRTSGTTDSVVCGAGVSAYLECTTISDSVGTGDVLSIASGGTLNVAASTITGTIANSGTLNRLVIGGDSSLGGEFAVGSLLVNAIEIDTGVPGTGEALIYDGTKYAPDAVLSDPTTTEGDVIYRDGSGLQRLGIGSAGQLLRTNSAETAPTWGDTYAWRNRLINGDFNVWQRGVGPASFADDEYCADRWYVLSETGNVTATQIAGSTRRYRAQIVNPGGSQRIGIVQIIEGANCQDLHGQDVTLSMRLQSNAAETMNYAILEWTGTEDAVTSDIVATWASTPTWVANVAVAGSIGSTALAAFTPTDVSVTATLGSSFTNLIVFVWTAAAVISNTQLLIEAAQLEEGPYATSFETRSVGAELAMCKRYFERFTTDAASEPLPGSVGRAITATEGRIPFGYTEKRVAPSISSTTDGYDIIEVASAPNDPVLTFGDITPQGCRLVATITGTLTVGEAIYLRQSSSVSEAHLDIDAEL